MMIFLSAQPDDFYFMWQLELQLFNFSNLGIRPENIHILIAYNSKKGLRSHFREFIELNKAKALFFTYPDCRTSKKYLSSVRPNVIKQHFQQFPHLETTPIFYHDSDIIFKEMPDFDLMIRDECWYVSDASSYMDTKYILDQADRSLLEEMCQVVTIDPQVVFDNDHSVGGAQYLLKNTNANFWDKIERDCEELYIKMTAYNNRKAEELYPEHRLKNGHYKGIQAWCADMWALLWNGWLHGYTIKTHQELAFCWSNDTSSDWSSRKILHYSGSIPKELKTVFRKGNYAYYSPIYDIHLHQISEFNCSFNLVKLIQAFRAEKERSRTDLKDVSFLIPIRVDSESRLENLYCVLHYLNKYFDTHIILLESDVVSHIDQAYLPDCCDYYFVTDSNHLLHRTKLNNLLIKLTRSPYIALYDTDVVLPVSQIMTSVKTLREEEFDMVYPYDGEFTEVDSLFKAMFEKILDPAIFTLNHAKFISNMKRSVGGAVFFKKSAYLEAGIENEYFTSWGVEDMERFKRMKNLGYSITRIKGPLYHLPHDRQVNSGYAPNTRPLFLEEYFRICNMSKLQLKEHISTWSWINT